MSDMIRELEHAELVRELERAEDEKLGRDLLTVSSSLQAIFDGEEGEGDLAPLLREDECMVSMSRGEVEQIDRAGKRLLRLSEVDPVGRDPASEAATLRCVDQLELLHKRLTGACEEIAGFQRTFDLMHAADMQAIEAWQAESPAKRALMWPDRGVMVKWLLERNEKLREELEVMRQRRADDWGRP